MLLTTPVCDVCTKQKGFTNSWFIVFFKTTITKIGKARFAVYDYTPKRALIKGAKHICGELCLSRLISDDLTSRTKGKEGILMPSPVAKVPAAKTVYTEKERDEQVDVELAGV